MFKRAGAASAIVWFLIPALSGCLTGGGGSGSTGQAEAQGPLISGEPQLAAAVGQNYLFQPTTSDPGGEPLVFAVQNLPPWASFDTGTGRITGTPSIENTGSYAGIVISVSDGTRTASLDPFTITVAQVGEYSVTLSWTPPTANTDGSPLTDLAGYIVYYGPESRNYSNSVNLNNPGLTRVVLDSLAPGRYFFAVRALDRDGNRSSLSAEGSTTLG